jgi:hypothetical protein
VIRTKEKTSMQLEASTQRFRVDDNQIVTKKAAQA